MSPNLLLCTGERKKSKKGPRSVIMQTKPAVPRALKRIVAVGVFFDVQVIPVKMWTK